MNPWLLAALILTPTLIAIIAAGVATINQLRGPRTAKHYRPVVKRRGF